MNHKSSAEMSEENDSSARVSFCISTYRRPDFLKNQLALILRQVFRQFEVVISDNDPEGSAEKVAASFGDDRLRYFRNVENLGMIKSFNKSIERANTEYVVMITDDDPVYPEMLEDFLRLAGNHPGYPIYCGCKRTGKKEGEVEIYDGHNFVFELLNSNLTPNFLWSSCLLKRKTLLEIGGLPDYGSPHLSDHAMLALCSRNGGGVMMNRMYSDLSSHDTNFSKSNFNLYYLGCQAFYNCITESFVESDYKKGSENALIIHLERWFIDNAFTLKKYFAYKSKDMKAYKQAAGSWSDILSLPFMRGIYPRFVFKTIMFYLKYPLYRFGIIH